MYKQVRIAVTGAGMAGFDSQLFSAPELPDPLWAPPPPRPSLL
jgi:hypothetical protein